MKSSRMFSILIYLLQKQKVSAEELANTLEVSTRTIYRDMDALSSMGIPIISYLGKNGGFTLLDNYQLDRFTFNEEEKKSLIEGLNLKDELFDHHNLSTLQRKIELLQENKDENHPTISISSSTLHRETIEGETKRKIKKLLSIMEQGYKIRISYVSQTANITHRTIQPITLHFMNGSWYVEAFCESKEALRLFKLTRIRNIEVIYEKVRIEMKENPIFPTSTNPETITLLYSQSERGKLYDFFTDDEIVILEDGRIKVTFTYDINKNLLPFLLMFGRHVKILSPDWLKRDYLNEIKFIYES